MIGKFLENEENSSAVKSESNQPQTEETTTSADVFSLPKSEETDFQNFEAENRFGNDQTANNRTDINQTEAFGEQQPAINPENYTVAPPDALAPANVQTEPKNDALPAETTAENLRKTGLAWSAATVLGGSVIFMMVIGWFFDLVFGSKPWGIVGGIILGAIVGFIQFFRITSQIFKDEGGTSTGILDHKD